MINRLSPLEEFEHMKKLDINDQGFYYFIPRRWLVDWVNYTKGKGSNPGMINFNELLDKRGQLKLGLELKKDYQTLNKDQWQFIKNIYKSSNEFSGSLNNIYQRPINPLSESRKNTNEEKPPLRPPSRQISEKMTNLIKKPEPRPIVSDFQISSTESLYKTAKPDQSNPRNLLLSKDSKLRSIRSTTPAQIKKVRQETPKSKRDSNGSVSSQTSTPSNRPVTRLSLISSNLSRPTFKFGLHNPRFQCFLNTVVQCLFSFPGFIAGLMNLGKSGAICRSLQMIIQECKESRRSDVVISCSTLAAIFSRAFPGYKQHDAPEFCRALLDGIDNEFPKNVKKTGNVWDKCKSQFCSLISEEFLGLLCSTVTCCGCRNETYSYEPFTTLMLELKSHINKSILDFLSVEEVSDYKCEKCRKLTRIKKGFQFQQLPRSLIVQLKRFKCQIVPQKLDSRCEFEMNLEIMNTNGDVFTYELVAVGVHLGSAFGGHYFAYCLRDRWYKFDDSTVTEVDLSRVLSSQAYLLCYKLIE